MSRSMTVRAATATVTAAAAASMLVLPGSSAFAENNVKGGTGSHITGTTRTGAQVHLHDLIFQRHYPDDTVTDLEPTKNVEPNTSTPWVVRSIDDSSLEVTLQYRIYDQNDKPTPFWVNANFRRPNVGSDSGTCEIYKGVPTEPREKGEIWEKTLESPYLCGWSNFSGKDWNPAPYLDVKMGDVITDKTQAGKMLMKYCSEKHDDIACTYTNAKLRKFVGEREEVGDVGINFGSETLEKEIAWEHTTEETNDVKIGLEFEYEFTAAFKAKFSAEYGYSWTESNTKSEKTTIHVPPRRAGWFEYGPAMQEVTGDWVINTGDHAWILHDVTFTGPNPKGQGALVACESKVFDASGSHGPCELPKVVDNF